MSSQNYILISIIFSCFFSFLNFIFILFLSNAFYGFLIKQNNKRLISKQDILNEDSGLVDINVVSTYDPRFLKK